ncbi:hypothetical protein A3D01_00380 [Candidatus Woesebacteria bacterium RIFCSPHIGHO2_02_FULL_39_13]|uniref:Uncharacterized protein n=1 Tax=Candidatus Woesebacteria bacterium RIFCSPHIGHO2_02_FULL_39_13 TaxID=1802505 RepID=A0A1F7Z163_9BACT|nr:MAG: hypothetical protein A3D01_00380 [Candidatus Woesebacteria bacterium RIFCSPHIGHO2_02_FULL_39_13]
MKILKKILKNFTWFDYSVFAVVLIVMLVSFLFFYRKSEFINIRVKVSDQHVLYAWNDPQNWYANRFNKGDVEKDSLGRVISQIIGVETFNIDSDRKAVYLDLRVKTNYDSRTKLYSAKGKSLVFGVPLRFNFSGIVFDAVVTEFPESKYQENLVTTNKIITVIVRGAEDFMRPVEPKVIESLKKGDRIVDSNSNVLAEIIDIKITPAERVVRTDRGELLLRLDPVYKDALITIKVRTKIFNEEAYIFDDSPLRLGEELSLSFNKVFVESTVVGIND